MNDAHEVRLAEADEQFVARREIDRERRFSHEGAELSSFIAEGLCSGALAVIAALSCPNRS
jgi:hypothetical protein